MQTKFKLSRLVMNTGQIPGLPKNPRQWTATDVDRLARSIQDTPELLDARPLIVVEHGYKFVVLGGNLRLAALKKLGWDEAPCYLLPADASVDKLKEIVIKDNGSFGQWDYDLLANEWDDLDLAAWGTGVPDDWGKVPEPEPLDAGKEKIDKDAEVKEDDFDETVNEVVTRCNPGDIWQLGKHRLMCGDSTDAEQVALLMNGAKADISFTSPPYGVNDGTIRKHQEKGKADKSATNFYKEYNDTQNGWPELIENSYLNMRNSSGQQFINIQLLADNKRELIKFAAKYADNIVDVLVWDKGHAAPQMQDNIVNNNCEFVFVFGKANASRTMEYGEFHGTFNSIIRVGVGRNEYADIHKAVFPVAFASEILRINSKATSVLDLFGGTGTTLIAAEQLGRRCFMMELDRQYCDVIISRWETFTGKMAQLITPGE